jgi:hypothetical protein
MSLRTWALTLCTIVPASSAVEASGQANALLPGSPHETFTDRAPQIHDSLPAMPYHFLQVE